MRCESGNLYRARGTDSPYVATERNGVVTGDSGFFRFTSEVCGCGVNSYGLGATRKESATKLSPMPTYHVVYLVCS